MAVRGAGEDGSGGASGVRAEGRSARVSGLRGGAGSVDDLITE